MIGISFRTKEYIKMYEYRDKYCAKKCCLLENSPCKDCLGTNKIAIPLEEILQERKNTRYFKVISK